MKLSIMCGLLMLSAAAAVSAQSTSPSATSPTTSNTPPTSSQAQRDMQSQKQDPLAMQTSAPEDWNSLKGHDRGYVSQSDAMPNGWLAQNFKNCDKNQDGKVSKAEYDECKKQRKE